MSGSRVPPDSLLIRPDEPTVSATVRVVRAPPRLRETTPLPEPPSSGLACGRFVLESVLGRGAYGTVWRARDRDRGLPAAVKVVQAEVPDAERAALLHEARAVASLDHPGIVRVVDVGVVAEADAVASSGHLAVGAPWLAMDLVAGGTLRDELGRADWSRLRQVLTQILLALADAHAAGIVHRDIKPANVLRDTTGRRVVLTDFGVATFAGTGGFVVGPRAPVGSAGEEDTVAGTPTYMSPEQARGEWRAYGPWTDLYSVGCLAWALATGRPPFPGKGVAVMNAHLHAELPAFTPAQPMPEGLERWLHRMLAKAPARRPAFAADALRALLALEPTAPRRPVLPPDWRRRDAWMAAHLDVAEGERLVGLRTLPIVGREAERDALWSALRRCVEQRTTAAVVLRGTSGLGKSRLAAWLAARAHAHGAAHVVDVSVVDDAVAAVGAAIARSVGGDGLVADAVAGRLRRRCGTRLEEEDVAALAELAAPGSGHASARRGHPAWRHALIGRWLRALGHDRPVVVRIDDAQRDPEALHLARALLAPRDPRAVGPAETGLLVLVTVEEDASSATRTLDGANATDLPLAPLDTDAMRTLTHQAMGLGPRLAARVIDRAAGNPNFAEQLVRGWIAADAVVQTGNGLEPRGAELPEVAADTDRLWTVRASRHLASLTEPEAHAVEIAATLGTTFDVPRWSTACRHAGVPAAMHALESLASARLLVRPIGASSDTFAFVHARLREAAMAIGGPRLSRWHAACAQAYTDAASPAALRARALHLFGAADWDAALPSLTEAARAALQAGQTAFAAALTARRAEALVAARMPPDDEAHGEQAVLEASVAIVRGEWRAVEAKVNTTLEAGLRYRWRSALAHARAQEAVLYVHTGRLRDAVRASEAALLALRDLPFAAATDLADALRVRGDIHAAVGALDAAEQAYTDASALYAGTDDHAGAARCDVGRALVARQRGRYAAARRHLATARAAFVRAGHRWGEAVCVNDTADLLRLEGDLVAADAGYREACERYLALGARPIIPDVNRALLLADRGLDADALALLAPLRDHLLTLGPSAVLVHVLSAIARSHYALGQVEEGRAAFDAVAAELARERMVDEELSRTLATCARHAFTAGDGGVALRAAAVARELSDTLRGNA